MDEHVHPEVLEETPPQFLLNWFYFGVSFIETYGWYLLGASLLLYYLRLKAEPYFLRWREEEEERKFAALCHKNPDLIRSRQEALEASRLRLQKEHDARAQVFSEQMKEREARKREEFLSKQTGGSYRLGHGSSESSTDAPKPEKKPSNRPDYNPLMGGGSSGGYRPARRSCPGGGCG